MFKSMVGQEIGVREDTVEVYHPYPLSPVENASDLAVSPDQPVGITLAGGHLPNPTGRNLVDFFGDGSVIRAFDLVGLIVHNQAWVELTNSPLDFVRDSKDVVGVGAIISAEEDFTIHAIATRSDFRADQFEQEGARVSRRRDGLYVAQFASLHFEKSDQTQNSLTGRLID